MDILMYDTPDGGEVSLELVNDTRTAVYLSLFGGNVENDAYWGIATLKSRTEHVINKMKPSSRGIVSLKKAVESDLSWMPTAPEISVSIPEHGRVLIKCGDLQYETEWTNAIN